MDADRYGTSGKAGAHELQSGFRSVNLDRIYIVAEVYRAILNIPLISKPISEKDDEKRTVRLHLA